MGSVVDYFVFFAAVLAFGLILFTVAYELTKALVVLSRRMLRGLKARFPRLVQHLRRMVGLPAVLRRPARAFWAYALSILVMGPLFLAVINTLPQTALKPFLGPIAIPARYVGMAIWTALITGGVAWGGWDGLSASLPRRRRPARAALAPARKSV